MKTTTRIVLMTVALTAAMMLAIAGDEGSTTYTKPIEKEPIKLDGDVQVRRSYQETLVSQDGVVPAALLAEALERADSVVITGLLIPLHACDTAADCESEVDDTCVARNAGGRDSTTAVAMEWNSSSGQGECTGTCSNGGTVIVSCKRRS